MCDIYLMCKNVGGSAPGYRQRVLFKVCSHCPTKYGLFLIVWRCSYCAETDTNTIPIGFCANLSVSVLVSGSVKALLRPDIFGYMVIVI